MANVSLMPHNGVNRRRRRQRQLPAASKICNIHQSHSTAHSASWPGMRMSSRAALERSNSFRIRVFAYSHSYSWTYSYSFSEPTAGSSCACGALFFFGAPIDLLGAFSSQLHIFVAFAALKYENQCGGSTLCHCRVVGVSSVSVSLCFPCINSSGSLSQCVCVCVRGMPQQNGMCPPTVRLVNATSESRCQSTQQYFMSNSVSQQQQQ